MGVDSDARQAAVGLRIDGISWARVTSLARSGPDDQDYVASIDRASGATSIAFGDGVTGKRPPRDLELVRASYRSGAGGSGNAPNDADNSLKALLEVISDQVADLEDDLNGLYADWYIEASDEWRIPFRRGGQLLGEWIFSRTSHRWCLCLERSMRRPPSPPV